MKTYFGKSKPVSRTLNSPINEWENSNQDQHGKLSAIDQNQNSEEDYSKNVTSNSGFYTDWSNA